MKSKYTEYLYQVKKFFYNKRNTEAIILAVIFVIILSFALGQSNAGGGAASGNALTASGEATAVSDTGTDGAYSSSSAAVSSSSYRKEEEGSDLHNLLAEYYKDYAAGDVDDLEKVASPISDMEKSYIKFMSGLLDSYDIKEIYTKDGADENSRLVSVYVQMHFKEIKSAAPGLDFFYVQKQADGTLTINNLYSSFNQTNHENDMDPSVVSAIASFEEQADVVDLQTKVQKEYNEISISDKDFDEFMSKTYPAKVKKWQSDYRKQVKQTEADKKKEEAKQQKEEKKKEDEEKKEEKKDSSDKKSNKTTYKTTTKTNLRKKATIDSDIVKTLKKGAKVTKVESDGKWMKVKYKGKTGYIRKLYLKKVK